MHPSNIVLLEFHPERDDLTQDKELRDGLSVALRMGNTLWLANDESVSIERLTLRPEDSRGKSSFTHGHRQYALHDLLPMPMPATVPGEDALHEADVEGLAYDGKYLWVAGSHSLRRKQPKDGDGTKKAYKRLASVSADGNRYLLARIPVVEEDGGYTLVRATQGKNKPRTAAILRGDVHGNELTQLLKQDEHLGPFLAIPGKDNGFDIEGLAVAGKHLLLGLRGPVLRGWATIIEVALVDGDQPSQLRLGALGKDGELYRKHFLDLHGLGIRDLCAQDDDLLILAGPTMDLDGPVVLYRWIGGARPDSDCIVAHDTLEHVCDLPFGQGVDHPEGMTLFSAGAGTEEGLLVVHDAASPSRQIGESILVGDVFPLPKRKKRSS